MALPRRRRGYFSPASREQFYEQVTAWCNALKEIDARTDFKITTRGWCYILEEYGLDKGDFKNAQALISSCRKDGRLPIDFVADDKVRAFNGVEAIWGDYADDAVEEILKDARKAHALYTPWSFWDDKDVFIQAQVEKIDLVGIFGPLFEKFHIPYANTKGWSDMNSRARMMARFAEWEAKGKTCVLLYCGDHDPGGLHISDWLRSNMEDLSAAVGWSPDDLVIDRFGLNFDFIEEQGLAWVDNLETGSGKYPLDDPRHKNHNEPWVQDYIAEYGVRKCEANAIVTRIDAGRDLCRDAILKYLKKSHPAKHEKKVKAWRADVAAGVAERVLP